MHDGLTNAAVLKNVLQANVISQLDGGLTKTFQNDRAPNGNIYPARFLMDNCEVWAGLNAAVDVYTRLGDTNYAATLTTTRNANLAGIESLWQPEAGAYRWERGVDMRTAPAQAPFYPWVTSQYWAALCGVPLDPARQAAGQYWADMHYQQWATRNDSDALASLGAAFGAITQLGRTELLPTVLSNTRFKSLRSVPYGNTLPAAFIISDAAFYLNLVDRSTPIRSAPTINRTLDRWGNALAITDPRSANYVTSYRYNANNQVIETWRPDANGTRNAGPLTRTYYDAMGHQVTTRDAKGQVNGTVYNAAGQVVQVRSADGGIVTTIYDLLGNQARTIDARGVTTFFNYDRLGRLIQTIRPVTDRYRANDAMALEYTGTGNPVEYQSWDSLGRRLSQTNAAGEITRYTYDLTGNLLSTTLPMGQRTSNFYDLRGRQTAQLDANTKLATWTYDSRGLLTQSTDIGGVLTTYRYDTARQQVEVRNTRGKTLTYRYDAAGQLIGAYDGALDQTTRYAYDAAGNRVLERTTQQGKVYQDNHLAYDALGRLRDVADARAHLTFDYDANGNRTRITTHTADPALEVASDRYFQYDAMDRQIVVDAIDAQGNLGTVGHRLTYDVNGNRITDLSWGNHVTVNGGQTVITGYDDRGKAKYVTTPITYTKTTGPSLEVYAYDGLNRLTSVVKDGIQLDHRYYDAANRLVQTGPEGNLPVGYAQKLNEGLPPEQVNGLESRLARFDANGRIIRQLILRSDNSLDTDQRFDYDAVGNLTNDTRFHYTPSMLQDYTDAFTHGPAARETYKDAGVARKHIQPPGPETNSTLVYQYDANGNLVGLDDTANNNYDRTFVNDVNGQLLFVNQAGNVSRQFIVNGEVLGVYGVRPNAINPTNAQGNPNFAALAEFSFGYQPIASRSLAPSPGNYTTQAGDTLTSIAQRAYGDARLWFRIAEANSLQGDQDLRIGQTLTIPNVPAGTHNDQNTTNAPNPFNSVGDLTPALPMPQGQGGGSCGGMGAIVTAAIAIAVTVALHVPVGLPGAAAAAGGSVAGQVAGNVLGTQHGFSWKQVALAAIGAQVGQAVQAGAAGTTASLAASEGVSQGVSQGISQVTMQTIAQTSGLSQAFEAAKQAALTSTITQGIGVVTGLQSSFSWKGVVASAAGAGVGRALQDPLTQALPGEALGTQILRSTLKATAAGTTTALLQGGKLNTVQIASDAFGNALGYAFVDRTLVSATQASVDVEAQYRASSYAASAYSVDDYDSNVNDSNPDFYSDTEANQDFAREQLRFSAAQSPVNNTASYRSNNAPNASQPTSAQTFATFSPGSNAAPLSINAMGVMAIGQPTLANATPDLQPDGVYVDDKGTRHFRVNIFHESRPDPITQFKAAIQDRLDQWGADAIARDDGVSLAIGGALTALNEVVVPNSSVELAIGLAAGPVLGKGLAWGMRGLELAASRTALTSWLAADITKVPGAVSQAFAGPIDAALRTGKESISELGRTAAEMAENWMINQGGVLRAVEGKGTIGGTNTIGVPVTRSTNPLSPVLEFDAYGNEIMYRTMSERQFERFSRTGKLPSTTETSISPSLEYSSKYDGVTVKITVAPGTSAQLQDIGIAANKRTAAQFPNMSTQTGSWMQTNARFKVEGGQMTTQLGQGKAINIFNQNIVDFGLVHK